MINKNGMDYGPFSVREIEQMIEDGDLTGTSEVISYKSKITAPVAQVPQFASFLAEKEKRDREAARRAEIEHDTNTAIRDTKRRHTMPVTIGAILLVASSIGAWALLHDPEIPTSGYPVTFYRDLSVPILNPMKARLASPVAFVPETAVEKAQKPGGGTRRGHANGRYEPGVVPEPVLDFSFGGTPPGGARELTAEDLEVLKGGVTPGLIRCFQRELTPVDGFSGGKIVFYVMPKGKVALSKVETNPPASSNLVSCVSATVNSKKVPPYTGDIQIIEVPLYVAAQ